MSSKRRPTSRNEISWQWEAPRAAYADFIWWQVVRRRWSTHLEQPIAYTWCHPRLVCVILDIRKNVEIILVCLTTVAPVLFNWRLTNALTNLSLGGIQFMWRAFYGFRLLWAMISECGPPKNLLKRLTVWCLSGGELSLNWPSNTLWQA